MVLLFTFKALADDKPPFDYHVIYPINDATATAYKPTPPSEIDRPRPAGTVSTAQDNHTIRASTAGSETAVRQWLTQKDSPIAVLVPSLLQSPYWSTIIGICTIEEYSCSVNPYDTNNLWGIMANGHLKSYPTLRDGIDAIEAFLAQAEDHGRNTIESFAGWYCVDTNQPHNVCPNWQPTVLRIKTQLESL